MTKKNKNKQAVILIHGIGSQRPGETITQFVEALAGELKNRPAIRFKQEEMSEFTDHYRLQIEGSRDRRPTDFFEFYWGDLGTTHKLKSVYQWLWGLIFKSPRTLPIRLKVLLWINRFLLIAGIGGLIGSLLSNTTFLHRWEFAGFAILIGFLQVSLQALLTNYVGDAACYFDNHPENVKFKEGVSKRGLALLKNIHESNQYSRVIIVGHSLGSVIGYDLIKNLWGDYHEKIEKEKIDCKKQIKLASLERQIVKLKSRPSRKERKSFKKKQALFWEEQRNLVHNPWLITDFVTLGSPLAHANFLFDTSTAAFTQGKNKGRYPTCPPVLENGTSISYERKYTDDKDRTQKIRVIKDSAPFAVVAWVNLYFAGDIVGGPLKGIFGSGIRDEQVFLIKDRWQSKHFWTTHTRYWEGRSVLLQAKEELIKGTSIRQIKKALDLEFQRLSKAKKVLKDTKNNAPNE